MNLFMCEWLKTRRTPLRWTVFLSPLIFSALILWYFSLRKTTLPVQIAIFEAFFEVWPALVIPAGAGLVSGLMVHQEGLAGNFGRLLGAGRPRRDLYLGKLAMLVFLVFTSTLLAVLALAAGIWFLFRETIAWPVFLGAAFMMMIGTLPLLAFHLWISFARGMGASIGIGGGGLLMASLMATSLGQTICRLCRGPGRCVSPDWRAHAGSIGPAGNFRRKAQALWRNRRRKVLFLQPSFFSSC